MFSRSPTSRCAAATEGPASAGKSSATAAAKATAAPTNWTRAPVDTVPSAATNSRQRSEAKEDQQQPRDRERGDYRGGHNTPCIAGCAGDIRHRLAAQHLQDRGGAGDNAGAEVAAAKVRQNLALDYRPIDCVGQRSLKPVADFDADLVLLGRDNQQHAVVFALLPDSPEAAELVTEIFDRKTLQRRKSYDHDLLAAYALVL